MVGRGHNQEPPARAPSGASRRRGRQVEPAVDLLSDNDDDDKEEDEGVEDGDGEHSFDELIDIYRSNAAGVEEAVARAISTQKADRLVAQVVRHMLFRHHGEPGVPVRREDLVKIVLANYRQRRQLPGHIVVRAQARLADVFGYEMRELERMAAHGPPVPGDAPKDPSAGKSYVLRSLLPAELRARFVDDPRRRAEQLRALGLVVVGLLRASQDRLEEKQLWGYLGRLAVERGQEDHPAFGNVRQAFAELEKQRYVRSWRGEALPEGGHEVFYTLAENGHSVVPAQALLKHFKVVAASAS